MKIKDIIELIPRGEIVNLNDKHGFIQEMTNEDRKDEKILLLDIAEIYSVECGIIGIEIK